jgi:hypothetical protein
MNTQSTYIVNTPFLKKLKLKLFGKLISKEIVDYHTFKIEFTCYDYNGLHWLIRKII